MNPATRSFLRAAAEGDANLVRALLAQGTNVNSKNAAGQTALMLASAFGHLAVVKILLAAGAERELQDDLGFTALDWSINYTSVGEAIAEPLTPPPPSEVAPSAPMERPLEPVSPRTEESEHQLSENIEPSRRGLGGLAGAILRDRAVKVTDELAPTKAVRTVVTADQLDVGPPSIPSARDNVPPVDATIPSNEQLPGITPSFDREPAPLVEPGPPAPAPNIPPIPSIFQPRRKVLTPLPEDDIPDLPSTFEKSIEVTTPPPDDETWSGRERDDTASPGTRPIAAARILGVNESAKKPVTSKVKVDVPSFNSIHQSTPRPIIWLLIILFIGIGAFGGYRLSNYLFEKQNNEAPKETAAPQNQALAAPIKLGPVVGGNLSGMELLVPDATYPPSAKIKYGSVTVRVQVDQRGVVTSARATDGDRTLHAAAEEAARRATFSPEKLRDKGRFVVGSITYNFLAPQAEAANSPPEAAPSATSTIAPAVSTETANTPKVGGPLSGAQLKVPAPEYPSAARRNGIKGTVTVVIRVNDSGKVISWRTLEGDQRLRAAAIKAARAATFSAAKLPGNGDVVGTITYTFQP